MAAKVNLLDVFHGRKSMLMALGLSVIIFLLIELIIFTVFATTSGEQSRIEVRDKAGRKIYDVPGTTLSQINFSYFERKYGDLANYDVEVKTIHNPFPVRAWVSASIGVPMVLILLISYLVKVYLTLLQGGEQPGTENIPDGPPGPGREDERGIHERSRCVPSFQVAWYFAKMHETGEGNDQTVPLSAHDNHEVPAELVGGRQGVPERANALISSNEQHRG